MDSDIWGLIFPVPKKISDHFIADLKVKRFIFTIKDKNIYRAMMPMGDGTYYIFINKDIAKELQINIGQEIDINAAPDKSKYGMPLPDELAECFSIYPDGNTYFHNLTMGKQRNLIYIVDKPKRSATRINKAIQIMEYLENYKGKIDFRQLNEWMKNYNS